MWEASVPRRKSPCTTDQSMLGTKTGLGGLEDLLELSLDLFLVAVLRHGELLDEETAGGVEQLELAEREVLVGLEQVEVTEDLGHLEHGARLDLLHVLAVAAVPRGGIDAEVLLLQDAEDLVDL